jgi:DNA mismatch repair protein MutL
MGLTIKILPETLACKIAAGEVVQRPASVVKELLENAVDAHAKSITIIIKNAGRTLINVIDDGVGMSVEDAEAAFQRHATSKIKTFEDLEQIQTLGFRGEALASIAAVSQVEMQTRQSKDDIGIIVKISGDQRKEISKGSMSSGTSITVKNLFYNTPGRRKFLKSDTTEFKHISDAVQRFAISYPELKIVFISDNEKIFNLRPASQIDRIKDIFGDKLSEILIFFEDQTEIVNISGFLSKVDFTRKSRIEQYMYLNGRYILNRSINHAVMKGYENLLEKGSFPFFILFLKLDPSRFDVNVHPAKMEVKFEDEQSLYRFVVSSVRKALSSHDLIPSIGLRETIGMKDNVGLQFHSSTNEIKQGNTDWSGLFKVDKSTGEIFQSDRIGFEQNTKCVDFQPSSFNLFENKIQLWQIHNKYIIAPSEDGIMIIDQHAAHERVLYERAVNKFGRTANNSQQLIFPQTIEMTTGDVSLVKQLQSMLDSLGFSLKIFGKSTVIVDGVPTEVKPGQEGTILQDILDLFKEDENNLKLEPREKLAKSFSCKTAIKAGDPLNENEMQSLIKQLFATEIPFVCPHGRPVVIKMSLSELDKRFGRTP